MAYGKVLTVPFVGFNGTSYSFDIYQRDYSGDVTTRDGCPPAVVIDWGDGAGEDFATIVGSKATVRFYSETKDEFKLFYAADKRAYYGELVVNTTKVAWRGWIVPEQRNERLDYKSVVALTFMDGLGELKNIDFVDDNGDAYNGRASYISIISTILAKTGFELDIYATTGFTGVGVTGDAWAAMYVDQLIYEGLTCAEVLEQLLLNARIMIVSPALAPAWMIQSLPTLQSFGALNASLSPVSTVLVTRYSSAGVLIATGTRLVRRDIDGEDNYHIAPPNFTNWSAWDSLKWTNKYFKIDNLLANGDFEDPDNPFASWNFVDPMDSIAAVGYAVSSWGTSPTGNNLAIIHKSTNSAHLYYSYYADQYPFSRTITDIKQSTKGMRLRFNYNLVAGPSGIVESDDYVHFGVIFTRKSDGEKFMGILFYDEVLESAYIGPSEVAWGTMSSPRLGICVNSSHVAGSYASDFENRTTAPVKQEKAMDMVNYEILIKEIPFDCDITIAFWQYAGSDSEGDPTDYNLMIDDVQLTFIDANLQDYPDESVCKLTNDRRYIERKDDIEFLQGITPGGDPNGGAVYRHGITSTMNNNDVIALYTCDNSSNQYTYHELMARCINSSHLRPALQVDFQTAVNDNIDSDFIINDPNCSETSFFAFISLSFDFEESVISGVMVELLPFDEVSTFQDNIVTASRTTSTSRSSSSRNSDSHLPLTLDPSTTPEVTLNQNSQILKIDMIAFLRRYIQSGCVELMPGDHAVPFSPAFEGPYTVLAEGRKANELVIVRVINDTNLNYFIVRVHAQCTLRWIATLN